MTTKAATKAVELTPKQSRFVDEYLIDLNVTQAATRAGYSAKTAGRTGHDLLKKPEIARLISERMKDREKRTEITQDRVLKELARLGFADLRDVFTETGHIKRPDEWSDAMGAAVSSIEVIVRPSGEVDDEGRPEVEHVHKIRLWDKNSALEKIAKHLGMFTDQGIGDRNRPIHVQVVNPHAAD
ncbi:terminase small subunit [Vreelandella populi]|uniref:terminase small subunit n=1 Tax=Vreelandella populi TaxID=2498858 RepID=UPI000F8E79E0|nr:terminase small subunit [Halomonas populi]RUR38541.1 terminase small subunit [Halomonas populi]